MWTLPQMEKIIILVDSESLSHLYIKIAFFFSLFHSLA